MGSRTRSPAAQLGVNRPEALTGRAVGSEIDEVEIRMPVDETDELATGISGGAKDGDAMTHGVPFGGGRASERGNYTHT